MIFFLAFFSEVKNAFLSLHASLEAMMIKILDSIALFGKYFICLTNKHIYNRYHRRCVIENKQLIYVAKSKGGNQKAFQTDDMEIRYGCAKGYHNLCINCAIWYRFHIVICA